MTSSSSRPTDARSRKRAAIAARVEPETQAVSLALPPLPVPGDPIAISGAGVPATGTPMHVGVPHLVVLMEPGSDLPALDVAALGPPLRRHPLLPEGANV